MEGNGFTAKWYPVEANSWVLTDLIKKFGVTGVQVEELLSIDEGIIENLRNVHGFIIVFKDLQHEELSSTRMAD